MEQVQPTPRSHSRLIGRLLLMVAGAFAFAFALVPIYNVLCEATGFNGKTAGPATIRDGFGVGGLQTATAPASKVDTTRTVRVEFTGTVMPGLPWDMRPLTVSLDIHPGELQQVSYLVRNTSNRTITGQAVPSVTPGQAAQHFEKIECFCFSQQTLGPGEAREMPLAFIVKPEVSRDISHITLSYAFFSIDGQRQTLTRSGEAR
ncbi:MAG: Cytochrome c oxidase assembly protein CtaG/Cox11 [Proteobacteria bacterium]|uniref:Cytochrome c oxidase assembly protein CtaG n=1 Tax=Dechloromonas aromatica (strain RCB) TaxID=159087 RepID=Q47G14_DECAR|nr:Cytochrome c oxidase assembly protein CtaG/Cox11 [Pseudomonadota bacterium]